LVVERESRECQLVDGVYWVTELVGGAGGDRFEVPLGCALGKCVVVLHEWGARSHNARVVGGKEV
jgi:hypothetical protein